MTIEPNAAPPVAGLDSVVGEVADEFLRRLERGERPDPEEYAARHPEAAELIRNVLKSLALFEVSGSSNSSPAIERTDQTFAEPLGDFRLIREVGRGGMGIVYEAIQLSLGRRVALKVLPFAAAMDPKQLQRFRNEALAAASLRHEHIVHVYGVGCERSVHFYAMEFIEGQTLAEVISAAESAAPRNAAGDATHDYQPAADAPTPAVAALSTKLSGPRGREFYRRCAQIIADAGDALEHAHQLGIVHRDIKPGNLMLDAAGKLWVADFGLARFGPDAGLTMSGDLLGTLRYMAPEQALARHGLADHRVDVYGLGCTLYELLTGKPAVGGTDKAEILRRIAFEDPVALRRLDKAIPAELETIALKCLVKNPNERYATAGELAADLRRFSEDKPILAKPLALRQRVARWARQHRALTAIYLLVPVTLALGALAGAATWFWQDAELARDSAEKARVGEADARQRLAFLTYVHGVNLAQRAWMDGDVVRTRGLLDRCPAELRGWEWRYMHRLSHGDPLILPVLAGAPLALGQGLAFSHDGRRVATLTGESATIWDVPSGRAILTKPHEWPSLRAVALSPDGRLVATGGGFRDANNRPAGGAIRVWDAATGRDVFQVRTVDRPVSFVQFSPDGNRVLGTSYWLALANEVRKPPFDFPLIVWDATTGKEVVTLRGHTGTIQAAWFSADGRQLTTAANAFDEGMNRRLGIKSDLKAGQKEIKVWNLTTGAQAAGYTIGEAGDAQCTAFSPDGQLLVSVSKDQSIKIWDLDSKKPVVVIPSSASARVSTLAFSADGYVAAGFNDGSVRIWIAATGQALNAYEGHTKEVWGVAFGGHELSLATSSQDGSVRVWDLTRQPEPLVMEGGLGGVAFHPDGQQLASGYTTVIVQNNSGQGVAGVIVWDAAGRGTQSKFQWNAIWPAASRQGRSAHLTTGVAFSPDGRWLACSAANRIRVWDWVTAQRSDFETDPPTTMWGVAFCPDGRHLAAAVDDGTARIWDLYARRIVGTLSGHTMGVLKVAFSPDGTRLATASADKTVKVWDWAAGRELLTLVGHTDVVQSVAFSPDGRLVASGSADKSVKIWDLANGEEVGPLHRGHMDWVMDVAFSPDGRGVASGCQDGTVTVWDLATGEDAITLVPKAFQGSGKAGPVHGVAYSPDGRKLACAANGITVWDATPVSPRTEPPSLTAIVDARRHSLAIAEQAVNDSPADAQRRFVLADLRNTEGIKRADERDWVESEALYGLAQADLEKLLAEAPGAPRYESLLGGVLHNRARNLFAQGDRPAARRLLDQAITHQLAATTADDTGENYREFLVNHYEFLSRVLIQLGEHGQAVDVYLKLVAIRPADAGLLNDAAWLLATCRDKAVRDPAKAVELATRAVEWTRQPFQQAVVRNTLGVAQYRAGNWKESVAALEKSIELKGTGNGYDWFFLAMARWQLSDRDTARKDYARAVEWMQKNNSQDDDLRSIQTEAEKLLGNVDGKTARPEANQDKKP